MDTSLALDAVRAYWDCKKSDRPESHIGMSALGHCGRQLAYKYHEIPGNPYDWRAKIIFDDGHLHHDQIRKALAEGLVLMNSCYSLVKEEEQVSLGYVTGHIDGMLEHDDIKCENKEHRDLLLEVKSMNDRGFNEFKKTGELSKEYAIQTSAYMRATGVSGALILAKNKNSGEMLQLLYNGDSDLLDQRLRVLYDVHKSGQPEDVLREYGPNAAGVLPWNCGYCPFVRLCWRDNGLVQKAEHKFELTQKFVVDLHNCNTKDVKASKQEPKS